MQVTIKDIREDSSAWCPTCKAQVRCCQIEYVRLGYRHDMTMWHEACDTTWKISL